MEETGKELGVDVIKVGWQEGVTLVRGGRWVGLKCEGGGWGCGVGWGLKDWGDREEGALGNESKKEQKEEVEAGREMGKLEVAFLSLFQWHISSYSSCENKLAEAHTCSRTYLIHYHWHYLYTIHYLYTTYLAPPHVGMPIMKRTYSSLWSQ